MKKETKVRHGTLVRIKTGMKDDPQHQPNLWNDDYRYILRDPHSLKIAHELWIVPGEPCIVVGSDRIGLTVLTPRGHVGWIAKEKMESLR